MAEGKGLEAEKYLFYLSNCFKYVFYIFINSF
jgi:hypothetical protein